MTTWLVLHRDVSGSVRIEQSSTVHAALVLDPSDGAALSAQVGETTQEVLRMALSSAATRPADGRPPALPSRVLCAPSLARQTRRQLQSLGIDAVVEEVEPANAAEDVFDSLVAVLAGRRQPDQRPSSEDWACLYAQSVRYLERRPWERWADDVQLLLDLRVDAARSEVVAVVLGNAGQQQGLALYPRQAAGSEPMAEAVPPGTILMCFEREALPSDLVARALRYGWPPGTELVPTFFGSTPEGPAELDEEMARTLTVAIAAVVDHDARGLRVASAERPESHGSVELAGNRMGTYRLVVDAPRSTPVGGKPHLYRAGLGGDGTNPPKRPRRPPRQRG